MSDGNVARQFDDAGARRVEAVYLTPNIVTQRARVLELLALEPGERVVDLGCGPGLLAVEMAQRVGPTGIVDGLDASSSMIAIAQARVAATPQVRLRAGDVSDLPYPDGTFNAAVCTQVYEFVADVPRALRELRRVLTPGGRALVMDTDWESCVWRSSDDARMRRMLDSWNEHCPHPHLPRELGPWLREAGFISVATHVIPIVNTEFKPVSYSAGAIDMVAAYARTRLGEATASAWVSDLKEVAERGEWFFSLNRYVFVARV